MRELERIRISEFSLQASPASPAGPAGYSILVILPHRYINSWIAT